jgi:hypothetical protein
MLCENAEKEMSLQDFWEKLQQLIPPRGEISWEKLWSEFGRKGTGAYINPLIEKGLVSTTFKGSIRIREERRGEKTD